MLLALRAQARPPLPPPMTRKSHSFATGAMCVGENEKCRENEESLEVAVFEDVFVTEFTRIVIDLMGRMEGGYRGQIYAGWSSRKSGRSLVTCCLSSLLMHFGQLGIKIAFKVRDALSNFLQMSSFHSSDIQVIQLIPNDCRRGLHLSKHRSEHAFAEAVFKVTKLNRLVI